MSIPKRPAKCHPERIEAARGLCWGCYKPKRRQGAKVSDIAKPDIPLSPKVEGVLSLDDMIRDVAELNMCSYSEAKKTVYAIFLAIINELKKGNEVSVKGFGVFKFVRKKGRKNPLYPEHSWLERLPDHSWVMFKPYVPLKRMLNDNQST